MGWNGSDSGKTKGEGQGLQKNKRSSSKPLNYRALIVRLFVVCGGLAVWFFYSDPQDDYPDKPIREHESHPIAEPTASTKTPEFKKSETSISYPSAAKKTRHEIYIDAEGVARYKKGNARVPNPEDFKNPIVLSTHSCVPSFRHPVETEIATLITLQPGDTLVGEADYRNMRQDFVEALADKIKINDDDTPYAREVKEAVIEMKKELAQRVKNGEDLIDILKEARSELMRSAQYKDQVSEIISEIRENPEMSYEDLKTSIEAANKMLTDKGIAPIKEGRFLRQRQRLLNIREITASKSPAE